MPSTPLWASATLPASRQAECRIDNHDRWGYINRTKEERLIGLFRSVFLIVLALAAVLASMMAWPSPAAACQGICAPAEEPTALIVIKGSGECRQWLHVNASLPEPLQNPNRNCRCLPYHTGQAGSLVPVYLTRFERPTTSSHITPKSFFIQTTQIITPQHPPNTSFVDIFINKSSLLI